MANGIMNTFGFNQPSNKRPEFERPETEESETDGTFDVKAARRAGYFFAEIADQLAQDGEFDVQGARRGDTANAAMGFKSILVYLC